MNEEVPKYNITIHVGSDYQIDLSLVMDDDTELSDYGALIYDETLRDGTGSTITNEIYNLSTDWIVSDETMIYVGSGEIIVGDWILEAQLREYAEAQDYFDFDIGIDTDGYKLTMAHDITEKIPYTHGVWDVFITNVDTGVRSKLICGEANIIRRVTR